MITTDMIQQRVKEFLFAHEIKKCADQQDLLIEQNRDAYRKDGEIVPLCLLFNGVKHWHTECAPKSDPLLASLPIKAAHIDIEMDFESHLNLVQQLRRDMKQIEQVFTLALEPYDGLDPDVKQFIRDVLPECLVPAFPVFQNLERQRPPGFTLDTASYGYLNWTRWVEKMEFYAATRVIYGD